MPFIVLKTWRFFPESGDSENQRDAFEDANLKIDELLFRVVPTSQPSWPLTGLRLARPELIWQVFFPAQVTIRQFAICGLIVLAMLVCDYIFLGLVYIGCLL